MQARRSGAAAGPEQPGGPDGAWRPGPWLGLRPLPDEQDPVPCCPDPRCRWVVGGGR